MFLVCSISNTHLKITALIDGWGLFLFLISWGLSPLRGTSREKRTQLKCRISIFPFNVCDLSKENGFLVCRMFMCVLLTKRRTKVVQLLFVAVKLNFVERERKRVASSSSSSSLRLVRNLVTTQQLKTTRFVYKCIYETHTSKQWSKQIALLVAVQRCQVDIFNSITI